MNSRVSIAGFAAASKTSEDPIEMSGRFGE
jgi:hypothetical protein